MEIIIVVKNKKKTRYIQSQNNLNKMEIIVVKKEENDYIQSQNNLNKMEIIVKSLI